MPGYLYVFAVGPVQGFISAARRTRDLWMGSHLLSEVSKAAAKKIAESGGKLLFPALDMGSLNLELSISPNQRDPDPKKMLNAYNVANIIYAELPDGKVSDLPAFTETVKKAARDEWLKYAESAKTIAGADAIDTTIWDEQVAEVFEFYAAWVEWNKDLGNYKSSHQRLMRLLAARKTTRNFIPAGTHWGVEKSSFDGARERVLTKKTGFSKDVTLRMRLRGSEELCSVALTKRLGGSKVPFPSISRVALDPWIRGICGSGNEGARKTLQEIETICRANASFASGTGDRLYQDFPFDGQIFFPERLNRLKTDLEELNNRSTEKFTNDGSNLEKVERLVSGLEKSVSKGGFGEPFPYLAILKADGDRMGRIISNRGSPDDHHKFSKQLAAFAHKAKEIVENDYNGVLVFAGGEDIFAFLPLDTCLKAGRDLHDQFGIYLKDFHDDAEKAPTLSVGIAIGHFLEPLEDLIGFAEEAEKAAKKPDRNARGKPITGTDRNGLAVHLHTRSGGDPIAVREQWKKKGEFGMDERLERWVEMYLRDTFPDGAAYDLRNLSCDYLAWDGKIPQDLLEMDVDRLLGRKRTSSGDLRKNDRDAVRWGIDTHEDLSRRADELILARRIADTASQVYVKEEAP